MKRVTCCGWNTFRLMACNVAFGVIVATLLTACGGSSASSPSVPPRIAATPAPGGSSAVVTAPAGAATTTPVGTIEGFQEATVCDKIGGWVWDSAKPDTALIVDAYDGNSLLITVTADVFRADLRDAGKGNGNHGFVFDTPQRLRDGRPHSVSMRIAGTDIGLRYAPNATKVLTCSP